jgi:hypothetical protein
MKDEVVKGIGKNWEDVIVFEFLGDEEPEIFVFPGAGCC